MGVAAGDFDNDGYIDVFITHFGAPNQLFRNKNGDGTFSDVTAKAGVASIGYRWGKAASRSSIYDRDGRLDLYVVSYVDLPPREEEPEILSATNQARAITARPRA